jgi:iron complex outermembrane receptor protein
VAVTDPRGVKPMPPEVSGLRHAATLWLCLLAASRAEAQQDTARADTAGYVLPPVTVTAAREPRSLFEIPLAVTRLTRRERFGGAEVGLDDALAGVPGVVVQSRYGGTDVRLVIRGYGARGAGDRSNSGTSRGVRILLDGVPETEPDGRTSFDNVDLSAVDQIEVVRSNASALWGNAGGGVVSLSTVPEFDRKLASLESTRGGFGLSRYAGRGGVRLGESGVRLVASAAHTRFEGWRSHSGSRRTVLNLSAVAEPGITTRLAVHAVASDNLFRIPGPLTRAQVDSAPRQANAVYLQRDERRHNRLGRLAVSLEQELGRGHSLRGTAFVGPKFLQRSERGTFRDFTRYHTGGSLVYRQRARLGADLSSTTLLGLDEAYQDGAILFYSLTPEGTRGDSLRTNKREAANNFGVFVQEELAIGDRLRITGGVRYDAITYSFQDFLRPVLDARRRFSRVTPLAGIVFRASPTHSLYASVGGGVEAPAGNETDPPGTFGQDTVTGLSPLLEPIRSTTVEVGIRRVIAPRGAGALRALAYDVSLYSTRVANELVPYQGGRFYLSAASAERRGLELGLTLQTRGGVALRSSLALNRHRYGEYVVDSVHYGRPGSFADYSGRRVVGVPAAVYQASVDLAPSATRPIGARLTLEGSSRWFADDANQVVVPAYALWHLTVGAGEPLPLGRGLAIRGFVTVENLAGRRFIASAFLNPETLNGEPVAFEPGLPRRLIVSAGIVQR